MPRRVMAPRISVEQIDSAQVVAGGLYYRLA